MHNMQTNYFYGSELGCVDCCGESASEAISREVDSKHDGGRKQRKRPVVPSGHAVSPFHWPSCGFEWRIE